MTYYTTDKVKEILKDYHRNKRLLSERTKDYASVGVAQSGIESTLPKAQGGTSDVVANEAIRHAEESLFYAHMITNIKYVEDRFHRITDENQAMVLKHILDGYSASDIARTLNCTRKTVDNRLCAIAKQITLI